MGTPASLHQLITDLIWPVCIHKNLQSQTFEIWPQWIAYTPNPVLLNLQVITTERWLGTLNLWEWTMQEWTYRHGMSRVDIAGMDLSA